MTTLGHLKNIKPLTPQTDKNGITALQLVKSYANSVAYTDGTSRNNREGVITALSMVGDSSLTTLELDKEAENLQYLSLSGNKSLKKVIFETSLPCLTHLYLDNCGLTEITIPAGCEALEQIYLQGNALTKVIFEGDCGELELLDVSKNQLTAFSLPRGFKELKYLYLNDNQLESVYTEGSSQLTILHLSNNVLKQLPVNYFMTETKALRINLSGQPMLDLESLYLSNNPLPSSVVGHVEDNYSWARMNCLPKLMNYFQDMSKGYTLDNEYKTLIIGNGKVGKSCLVRRLMADEFEKEWISTHGITLKQYKDKANDVIFNLWDFGGQDIYHATHRLFMASNALYLVLWDNSETDPQHNPFTECVENDEVQKYQNFSLSYWLDYTKNQGQNSPVIVVQTKMKIDGKQHPPQAIQDNYEPKFPFLEFEHIDSKEANWNKNGFKHLLTSMRSAVETINPAQNMPTNRANLRQALRVKQQADVKTMSIEDYKKLAEGLTNPMDVLTDWLVKTGVVFYKEGLFQDEIILDQAWAIEAVYAIFRRTLEKGKSKKAKINPLYYVIKEKNGCFSGDDLQEVWEKYNLEEQRRFISFMLSCEICFETTQQKYPDKKEGDIKNLPIEERYFVAPQMLSLEKPPVVEAIWRNEKKSWYLSYKHDFLHYGLIQSFIVRAQTLATLDSIWRMGISINKDGYSALIECQEKEIKVRITEGGKDLLNLIRNTLDFLQDNKSLETVSLDGENYVLLSELKELKDNPNELIKVESGSVSWLPKKDFQFFLQRDEKGILGEQKEKNNEEPIKNKELMDIQSQVRQLIGKARTDDAIKLIEDWASQTANQRAQSDIAMIAAAWTTLRREINIGVAENENKRRAVINKQVLDFDYSKDVLTPIPPPKPSTQAIKLLFLGANPFETGKLNLKEEYAQIAKRLENEKAQSKLVLQSEFSTTLEDFQVKINRFKPNIVHFVGHGKDEKNEMTDFAKSIGIEDWKNDCGLIFFDSDHRAPEYINALALDYNFETFLDMEKIPIEIVIFNACYSINQAELIAKRVKYVVGVNNKIADGASIDFTAGFYFRLMEDCENVLAAFRYGKGRAINKLKDRNHIVLFVDGEKTNF